MLRRRHKKSRGGCLECKKRHVKCDERRPVCFLCSVSERTCTYAGPPPAGSGSPSSTPKPDSPGSSSITDNAGSSSSNNASTGGGLFNVNGEDTVAATAAFQAHLLASTQMGIPLPPANPATDGEVNLDHMLLLHHAMTDEEFSGSNIEISAMMYVDMVVGEALKAPYLMYQLLAYSARHMAYLHPEQYERYENHAVLLQTRGVSLLNASWTGISDENFLSILFYASILGYHMYADALSKPHRQAGLDTFMTYYIHCLRIHRGVSAVVSSRWDALRSSKLSVVVERNSQFADREPDGKECGQLKEWISNTPRLQADERDACLKSIKYLQVGFDAFNAEGDDSAVEKYRYKMPMMWVVLVPKLYVDMLEDKRPEALIILAYFCVLLHYSRMLWQIGDAGAEVLRLIEEDMGPTWTSWLAYPRECVTNAGPSRMIP